MRCLFGREHGLCQQRLICKVARIMSNITQLTSDIRELINVPRKQCLLLKDSAGWYMLCSSLDVIEDADYCLEAFLETHIDGFDAGNKYMYIYGTLQALIVQQDAVKHLAESLKIPYTLDQKLKDIRDIRNDSVGHPTKRGRGTGKAFNFISRITINNQGFNLGTYYSDGRLSSCKDVKIPNLIATQRSILTDVLGNVIKILMEEEIEHWRKCADQKLADAFPSTLNYHLRKIREAIGKSGDTKLGGANINLVLTSVEQFKAKLEDREILEVPEGVTATLNLLEYPLKELQKYFFSPNETHINEKDAKIFAHFVESHAAGLLEMARMLDGESSQ